MKTEHITSNSGHPTNLCLRPGLFDLVIVEPGFLCEEITTSPTKSVPRYVQYPASVLSKLFPKGRSLTFTWKPIEAVHGAIKQNPNLA